MYNFIAISGWVFSLISTIIAIIQYREKEKFKNIVINSNVQKNKDNATGYQAGTIRVNNNGAI